MFKKKKKQVQKEEEIFVIPQIVSPYEGLKRSKDKFKPSVFASPIMGTGLSDKPTYDDNSEEMGDYDVKYDSFRNDNDKKITDEYNIKRFGTKYPGFDEVDEDSIREIYGQDIKIEKKDLTEKKPEPKKPSFSFIEDTKKNPVVEEKVDFSNDNLNDQEHENETESETGFNFDDFEPEVHNETKMDIPVRPMFTRNGEVAKNSTIIVRKQKPETNFRDTKVNNFEEVKSLNNSYELHQEEEQFSNKDEYKNENIHSYIDKNIFESKIDNNFREFEHEDVNEESEFEEVTSYEEPQELVLPVVLNPYQDYKLPPLSLISCSDDANETVQLNTM